MIQLKRSLIKAYKADRMLFTRSGDSETRHIPEKHFSKYLTIILTLFVTFSLLLITSILYTMIGKSMTGEFYHQLKAQQAEVGMILHDRFDFLRAMLNRISANDTLKDYMLKDNLISVRTFMNSGYTPDDGVFFSVYDQSSKQFMPELPDKYVVLKERLIEIDRSGISGNELPDKVSLKDLSRILYSPVIGQNDHYGTVFLFYSLTGDSRLWNRIKDYQNTMLLWERDGSLIDFLTGESVFDNILQNSVSGSDGTVISNGKEIIPVRKSPGFYLAVSTNELDEKKKDLIVNLTLLGISVFLLTILFSLYISRKITRRLDTLVSDAIGVAERPGSRFLNEERMKYSEFRKLARAFNTVLKSLFDVQEELKRNAEDKIYETTEVFRQTVEAAPDSITITRVGSGEFIHVNEAFVKITGYSKADIVGKSPREIGLFHHWEERNSMMKRLIADGEVNGVEIEFIRKNGELIHTLYSGRLVNFNGEECVVSVVTDITERKKSEKNILRSRENLQAILSSMPFGVVLVGADKTIKKINEAALKIIGYENEEDVIGRRCHDIMCPSEEDHCPILDFNEQIDRSEKYVVARDNRKIPVLKSAIRIMLDDQPVLLETFFDITDLKKAEKEKKELELQLQRAMKMEAIGTLAGGVAHDLNNILAGLVSYPELLLMDIPEDSHLRSPVLTIKKSGEKAAAIVQDLLTLARRGVSAMEVVNPNKIIEEYLKSPEHQVLLSNNPGVKVKVSLDDEIFNIKGSVVHLSKTIMNLVSNAAEAMQGGGEIKISTHNMYIDEPLKGYDRVRVGDYAVVTVSDTGIGMSDEDKERIFEPFYTKKKMGKSGTGLGMAVVWGTIKDHSGYIDIESEEGKGAVFKLYFPITRDTENNIENDDSLSGYRGNGEKILIIDDMEEQRIIAKGMLDRLNYNTASVPSGEDAVEYIKEKPVDLLVLDMIMNPGIDGLETYRRILEIYPGQKAIIASGYSEGKRVKDAQKIGAGAYIRKPYLLENIARAVRNELDRGKK